MRLIIRMVERLDPETVQGDAERIPGLVADTRDLDRRGKPLRRKSEIVERDPGGFIWKLVFTTA